MLAALLILASTQLGAAAVPAEQFAGQCFYPEAIRERAVGENLVLCNQAAIDQNGIVFSSRSWGLRMRFSGAFENGRLVVNSITGRDGTPIEARGLCHVYYANEKISTITCTGIAGGRSHLANFVVSRI